MSKNGDAQVANDPEDYEVEVWTYRFGWHHILCECFWIVLCILDCPMCDVNDYQPVIEGGWDLGSARRTWDSSS